MADNLTYQLPPEVTQAKEASQKLTNVAQQYGSYSEPSVSESLRKAVTDAYSQNQDIIGPLDTATQEYFQAPSESRLKYGTPGSESYIQSPNLRENLISQYVGNQAIPMLSLANILGTRFGRISDFINAGLGGWQTATQQAQNAATNARTTYGDLLNEYQNKQQYNLDLYKAQHPASGGGSDISSGILASIVKLVKLLNPDNTTENANNGEQMPTYNPGAVSAISSGGQWSWEWTPTNTNPGWKPLSGQSTKPSTSLDDLFNNSF
jgi:hypothetical protein